MGTTRSIVGIVSCISVTVAIAADPVRKPARDGAAVSDRPAVELTPAAVEKRLKQVESAPNLDEAVRKSLVEKYSAALDHLKSAEEHKKKADEFRQLTAAAPEELEKLKADLNYPPPEATRPIANEICLAEMQEALAKAEKEYEDLQKKLDEVENEPARRADRRTEIPGLLEAIRDQLEEIESQ